MNERRDGQTTWSSPHIVSPSRGGRRLPLLLTVPVALAFVTACGGGSDDAATAKPTQSASATAANGGGAGAANTNGVDMLVAPEILKAAQKASAAATSVHLLGETDDEGQVMIIDALATKTGPGSSEITTGGQKLVVLRIGSSAYIKANEAFWKDSLGQETAGLLSGKYLKVAAKNKDFRDLTAFTATGTLFKELVGGEVDLGATTGEQTRIRGRSAIAVNTSTGQTLYIATEGEPHVLQMKEGTHVIDFLDYGKKVNVKTPPTGEVIAIPT